MEYGEERLLVRSDFQEWVDRYLRRWSRCSRCPLSSQSRPIMRGMIPFDVLLVGEAPGESEDIIGFPFVGPSGKLLDHILSRAMVDKFLIVNSVICVPPRISGKIREPSKDEKDLCGPHVREMVKKFNPMSIVAVGSHASRSLYWVKHVHVMHPAALLRYPERKADIAVQQVINQISESIRRL